MKKTKTKIIIFLLCLIALATGAFFYFNSVFLPVHLKEIITKQASKYLNRPITLESIVYNPLHGVTIRKLRVYSQNKGDPALLEIERATFQVLLPAILKNKKIVIPSLNIQNPRIHIKRSTDKTWNFADLITARKKTATKPPLDFFLGSISIENAQLEIMDLYSQPTLMETIDIPLLKVNLSLEKGIKFQLDANIPQSNSLFNVQGAFSPLTKEIKSQITIASLPLAKYSPIFLNMEDLNINQADIKEAALTFKWQNNTSDLTGGFTLSADGSTSTGRSFKGTLSAKDFTLTKEGRRYYATSVIDVKNSQCTWKNDAYFTGNISAPKIELSYLDGDLVVRGNIDAPQSFIQLPNGRSLKGFLATRGLNLQWKPGSEFELNGDFLLKESDILLGNNRSLKTSVMMRDVSVQNEKGILNAEGRIETKNTYIDFPPYLSFKGDIESSPTRIRHQNNKLHLETFCQINNGDMVFNNNKHVTGDFSLRNIFMDYTDDKGIQLKTIINSRNLALAYKEKFLQGAGESSITLSYDPSSHIFLYEGEASLKNTYLKGVPRFEEIKNIEGTIYFKNNGIETKGLRLKTRNTNLALTGTLNNFKNPFVEMTATAKDFHIDSWQDLAQEQLDKIAIDPSGLANVTAQYKGPLPYSPEAYVLANAFLYEAHLSGEKIPHDISNISGNLKYDNGSVEWNDLKGTYKDRDYLISGTFINQDRPVFTSELFAENMSLNGRLEKRGATYQVDYLKGKFLQSVFDLKGDVNFNTDQEPHFDISGKLTVNLKNLPDLDPDLAAQVYFANPLGVVAANVSYRGTSNWQDAYINCNLKSPQVTLYDMEFYNASLTWQQNNSLANFSLLTTFYEGATAVNGSLNIKEPDLPFNASGQINKANLKLLGTDLEWKKKDIAGLLSLGVSANGSLKNIRQVEGKGAVAIEQGRLGGTNLLKGIWGLLLIPEYENIVFTQGQAKFLLGGEKISFNNIFLQSLQLDLQGNGWIDFNQNIDFDLTADFKETTIAQSKSIKKIPSQYLMQAAGFIGIKVGCTLTKPCHEKIIPKGKIIEKTTETLLEGVQDIFEGIFQ